MHAVILCGGSGTRLWPLSRKNYSKQFLSLYTDLSLLQETFKLVRKAVKETNIIFVTNKNDFFNVYNQIREISRDFDKRQILMEPIGMNTAPAIALAVKYLAEDKKIGADEPVIFLPADHIIKEQDAYIKTIKQAAEQVGKYVGTIGIKPLEPETGYGYIKQGEAVSGTAGFKVESFKEKPDLATAQKYLESGEYFWNSGMYIFSCRTFARELREHSPEMYVAMVKPMKEFLAGFGELPALSIDYAISEKSKNVIMFKGDFGWCDIGSFDALAKVLGGKDQNHLGIDSRNVFVHSDHLVATVGIEDVNIIRTGDTILVAKRGRSEEVKQIVNLLKDSGRPELEHNLIVHRPWGKYEVLIKNQNHQVKKITVYPGQQLSLQAHYHRAEHWIVVKGVAKIVLGEKEINLIENESTYIPAQTTHRLENPGKINLELIEVQTGSYLGEDDIIRFEDIYNRIEE